MIGANSRYVARKTFVGKFRIKCSYNICSLKLNAIFCHFDFGLYTRCWDAVQKLNDEKSETKTEEQESRTKVAQSPHSSLKVDYPADYKENKQREFSYQELVKATKNFKSDRYLGEGGFGEVYKGKLKNPKQVSGFSICSSFNLFVYNI